MSSPRARKRALVLVADDERELLELVRMRLADDYEVVTATDGERCLALLAERRPDLAVLDVRMPRLDGYEVIRRMRADPALAGVPVLLLSASVRPDEVERGFEAGADDFLRKPFQAAELRRKVAVLLERGRVPDPSRDSATP